MPEGNRSNIGMSAPPKANDNEHPPLPDNAQTDPAVAEQPAIKPGKRVIRPWLLVALLSVLIVQLTVRDDLRQNAV
jgi:hypothetical protein